MRATRAPYAAIEPINEATRLEVSRLLDELSASDDQKRASAKLKITTMGPAAEAAITAMLAERNQKSRNGIRFIRRLAPTILVYFVIQILVWSRFPVESLVAWLPIILYAALVAVGVVRSLCRPPASSIAAMEIIADKRALPVLLDAHGLLVLGRDNSRVLELLARLLLSLEPADGYILSAEHRRRLKRYLTMYMKQSCYMKQPSAYPSELIIAALHALGAVGDQSAVNIVQRLADDKRDTPVRGAARDCLVQLASRAESESASLLRAASLGTSNGELLRAASGQSPEDESLLRAVTKGNLEP